MLKGTQESLFLVWRSKRKVIVAICIGYEYADLYSIALSVIANKYHVFITL